MTRLRRSIVAASAAFALLSAQAHAQVVDQSTSGDYATAVGIKFNWEGQTFRPTASTVAGAGTFFSTAGSALVAGSLDVQLWSNIPNVGGATLLASGSTPIVADNSIWWSADVFWSAVTVNPGDTYFLAFHVTTDDPDGQVYTPLIASAYADGGVYFTGDEGNPNPPTTGVNWSDFLSNPNTEFHYDFDMAFQEFSQGPVDATPEPASVVLMGTGLVGVVGVARRRRKNA